MTLSAAASIGDTVLHVVDQTGRDLEARLLVEDDVPVLLWSAHDNWEPGILSATAAGTLTLRAAIANAWPIAGTVVLPLALMALGDMIETQRPARGIAELDLAFEEAHVPLSPNPAELCGNPAAPGSGEDDSTLLVALVRPTWNQTASLGAASFSFDGDNSGGLHPNHADGTPPSYPEWDLFGYTLSVPVADVAGVRRSRHRAGEVHRELSRVPRGSDHLVQSRRHARRIRGLSGGDPAAPRQRQRRHRGGRRVLIGGLFHGAGRRADRPLLDRRGGHAHGRPLE
jgi:hypothetical protein